MQVYRETLELTDNEENAIMPHFENMLEPISLPGAEEAVEETKEVTQCQNPGQDTKNWLVPVKGRRSLTDSDTYRYSQLFVKTIFPVIVLLFMCIYWIIGLYLYYNPNI